jgi:hypothetical protein
MDSMSDDELNSMSDDELFEAAKERVRHRLKKILKDCNDMIADLKFIRGRRPESEQKFVPDEWAEVYARRQ